MKILALVSQKGGAGKSLISAHLSVAFEEVGIKTVVIDLDRQGSVSQWGKSRRSKVPTVIVGTTERLAGMLDTIRRSDVDLVVIDTPPHSDRNVLSAVSIADLILIPIRPSIFDLRAIKETAEIISAAKKRDKALIVLNAVPPQKAIADDAENAARTYGIAVAPMRLTARADFAYALISGQGITEYESRGKAAWELRDLRDLVARQIGIKAKKR